MTETRIITPEDLAALPIEARRTIALWLVQRAESFRTSWVLPKSERAAINQALVGVAVDLAEPLAEDSTIGHAAHVIGSLR